METLESLGDARTARLHEVIRDWGPKHLQDPAALPAMQMTSARQTRLGQKP